MAEVAGRAGVLVVVPAGGTSARLGGADKTRLPLGHGSVLASLLDDLDRWETVVVGDARPEIAWRAGLSWVREHPVGGGPLAAIAAGWAGRQDVDTLVVVAGDQPFAGSVVPRLVTALHEDPSAQAALARSGGRDQPLLAAYAVSAIRTRLAGDVAGRPARVLVSGLRIVRVEVGVEALDIDTQVDLRRARELASRRAATAGVSREVTDLLNSRCGLAIGMSQPGREAIDGTRSHSDALW